MPLSAVFDGCPRLKKKFGNPQNANTHGSIKEWADCALKCEADKDCKVRKIFMFLHFSLYVNVQAWHYDSAGQSCVTMRSTGDGSVQDDDNFSAGLRGCSLHSNVTAFTTCSETAPSGQKRQVRLAGDWDNDL